MYSISSNNSNSDYGMIKGLTFSLLAHLGLFYAGYNIYHHAVIAQSDSEKLNVISVEIFAEKTSAPVIDIKEDQLHIKFSSPDNPEKKKSHPEKSPGKEIKKIHKAEVSLNKNPAITSRPDVSESSPDLNSSDKAESTLVSGSSAYNSASSNGEYKALYEQGIISKLERVKKYPERALIRRLEGEVLLYLELTAAGTIQDSAIRTSSGYSFFDSEVLSMVKRAGSFPKLSNLPESEKISYLIPISFKLS